MRAARGLLFVLHPIDESGRVGALRARVCASTVAIVVAVAATAAAATAGATKTAMAAATFNLSASERPLAPPGSQPERGRAPLPEAEAGATALVVAAAAAAKTLAPSKSLRQLPSLCLRATLSQRGPMRCIGQI